MPERLQVVSLSRLLPKELMLPEQSPPATLLAMMVLVSSVLPPTSLSMPPPRAAALPLTVLLVKARVGVAPPQEAEQLKIPPPEWPGPAVLPVMVLLVNVAVPVLKMPPPGPVVGVAPVAVFPPTELLIKVNVPLLVIPPPVRAVLLPTVLLIKLNVPLLWIPPPTSAALWLMALLIKVRVLPEVEVMMPPPGPLGLPCRMVTLEMETLPPVMLKTRKFATPG